MSYMSLQVLHSFIVCWKVCCCFKWLAKWIWSIKMNAYPSINIFIAKDSFTRELWSEQTWLPSWLRLWSAQTGRSWSLSRCTQVCPRWRRSFWPPSRRCSRQVCSCPFSSMKHLHVWLSSIYSQLVTASALIPGIMLSRFPGISLSISREYGNGFTSTILLLLNIKNTWNCILGRKNALVLRSE